MSDELKSCPFCGGEAYLVQRDLDERYGYATLTSVGCKACGIGFTKGDDQNPSGGYALLPGTGKPKAISAWNARAPVSVQEAAKVLLSDDEACLRLAEAYYADWAQDRVGCAKTALRAIAEGETK